MHITFIINTNYPVNQTDFLEFSHGVISYFVYGTVLQFWFSNKTPQRHWFMNCFFLHKTVNYDCDSKILEFTSQNYWY